MIFIFLIGIVIITGCGNHSIIENNQPALEVTPSVEEIVIWHTYSEKEAQVFENILIPLFEEKFPLIKVKSVRQSYNEQLKSAIISRTSANKPPDIIRMDVVWVPSFAKLDLLYPVSEFEDFDTIKHQFYEEPLKSNYYNGQYFGVPLNTNTKVSIYNRELLEDLGYDRPPDTMDEFMEMIEENQYVIGISGLTTWDTLHYFIGLGGMLTNPANTRATGYLDSQQSVDAGRKLLDLYQNGKLTPGLLEGNAKTWQGILDGNYVVIDEGPWFYSVNRPEDIELINEVTVAHPFPINNGKRAPLGGENLVISKATKHKEAAWEFLKWMTQVEQQTYLAQTGLIPANKMVELSGFFDQYPYYQTYLDSLDDVILRPTVAHWLMIDEIYKKYLTLIFTETISVEEGLQQAAVEIDQILESEKG
jgi:multiple sugar transport system substrate-binding protein